MANPGRKKGIKAVKPNARETYHRHPLDKEKDLEDIARLNRLGFTSTEIVVKLDGRISRAQIIQDLQLIRRRHLESMIEDRRILAMEVLEGIRLVRKEAYEAWLRSQQDQEEVRDKSGSTDGGGYSEQSHVKKGQVGNPAFLQIIRETIKDERDLLGLDEAIKVDVTSNGMSINWHELTEPTVIKIDPLEEIIEQERNKGLAMLDALQGRELIEHVNSSSNAQEDDIDQDREEVR